MTTISGLEGIKGLAGQDLGAGDWIEITQERINAFADATDDHQWIHVDVERAKNAPDGAPIAHRILTLSLLPSLSRGTTRTAGIRMAITHGLEHASSPAPVRSGAR